MLQCPECNKNNTQREDYKGIQCSMCGGDGFLTFHAYVKYQLGYAYGHNDDTVHESAMDIIKKCYAEYGKTRLPSVRRYIFNDHYDDFIENEFCYYEASRFYQTQFDEYQYMNLPTRKKQRKQVNKFDDYMYSPYNWMC